MDGPQTVAYIAIDLETTGLRAEEDRVVEVAGVRFDAAGNELGRYQRLINPRRPMPPAARAIHGLSDALLASEPPAEIVLPDFLTWLGSPDDAQLIAHNARFDAGFLGRELARLGVAIPCFQVSDTLSLARRLLPEAPNHQLSTLVQYLKLPNSGPAHRALADALRVKELWLRLDGPSHPRLRGLVYALHDPASEIGWPLGWDGLRAAAERRIAVRLTYRGGTQGPAPREVEPRGLVHHGGTAYLRAHCRIDGFEKLFRLDRIDHYEPLVTTEPEGQPAVAANLA